MKQFLIEEKCRNKSMLEKIRYSVQMSDEMKLISKHPSRRRPKNSSRLADASIYKSMQQQRVFKM